MRRGRNWTAENVQNYRQWIDNFISEFAEAGNRADCADLAIESLITYAEQQSLHVGITTRIKPRRVISEVDFSSYRQFARTARREAGARNLADRPNTRPIRLNQAKPGDLLIFNWRQSEQEPNIPAWHTFIFINQDKLWFGNLDREDGALEPQVPDFVSDDKPRFGENPPEFYLTHHDLYQRRLRRWTIFFQA